MTQEELELELDIDPEYNTIAIKYKEDLQFLSDLFLNTIKDYKVAIKRAYLEEDIQGDKKNELNNISNRFLDIYKDTMILSEKVVNGILKEKKDVEELDKKINKLKIEFNNENNKLNNMLDNGRAANPRRLDARTSMRKSYFMDIFYLSAITGGIGYLYYYYKNR